MWQSFTRESRQLRREALVIACAKILATKGVGSASVREITREAGVSPGLLTHYFSGIDALIAETYRWTGRKVQRALDDAVARETEPRARLLAYLTESFAPPIADANLLATWLAFWGLSKSNADIAQVHAEIYSNFRIGMERLIAATDPSGTDHRLSAIALTAFVDGLWLELSLGNAPFSADEACTMAERWLNALVGNGRKVDESCS